ncbi:MAG: PD40 domain-containing protein [Chloroflexi bacterium]|nr:PD40 domain-containing protein [Chloroflexota bacterium]
MTRRPAPAPVRPPRAGDPYGIRPSAALVAPAAALVGLAVVAALSFGILTGNLPFHLGGRGSGGGPAGANRTPTPSNVVIVPSQPPEATLLGRIVYSKDGNIWIEDSGGARQVTSAGTDSMPSFTPDGQWILYIETRDQIVTYRLPGGAPTHYEATYPILYKIHPDGSGRIKITDGLFTNGSGTWFYWLRQPVMRPDGRTIALFSDGPDPVNSDVVLQFLDAVTGKLTNAGVPESPPLGQQDAAWSPDGKSLLYVKNGRDAARGAPQIYRFDWATKAYRAVTGPGYNAPRWSPDGRYIVATRTSTLGTDVVILDPRTGAEIVRVTNGLHSWGAVWSPAGDSIAYLHIEGGVTDLRVVRLSGPAGRWTVSDPVSLTVNAGLDGASHPDWYIAPADLPAPTPAPSLAPSVPAASPTGS